MHEKPIYCGEVPKTGGLDSLRDGLAKKKGLMFLRWD